MESEEYAIKVEICEKCYEHEQVDHHSETPFIEAYEELEDKCKNIGIKMIRNRPPKYLTKAMNTKVSSRRFTDTNTSKVVEFPRKGAFEVYYFHILVFSKLQFGSFPSIQLLTSILIELKKIYKEDPTFRGFQRYRHLQFQMKAKPLSLQSIYSSLLFYYSEIKSQKQLTTAINRLRNENLNNKIKIVHPYSLYAKQEKRSKIQTIYCPRGSEISDRVHEQNRKKIKRFKIGKQTTRQKQSKVDTQVKNKKIKENLFSMVALKGEKSETFNGIQKKTERTPKRNVSQGQNQLSESSKRLYFSFLACSKKNQKEAIKKIKNNKEIKKEQNEIEGVTIKQNPNPNNRPVTSLTPRSNQFKSSLRGLTGKRSSQVTSFHNNTNNNKQNQFGKKQQTRQARQVKQVREGGVQIIVEDDIGSKKLKQMVVGRSEVNIDNNKKKSIKFEENQENNQTFPQKKKNLRKQNMSGFSTVSQSTKSKMKELNMYQPAAITQKFSQSNNYRSDLFNQKNKQSYQKQAQFLITGIQITKRFDIYNLRELYSVQQLKLFPNNLSSVKNTQSKLANIINLLFRMSPQIITRIFENKKSVSAEGIYCIWLMNFKGVYEPVYVNDQFAFDLNSELIYGKFEDEKSIWFMLLQKSIAKMVGGYDLLGEVSFSTVIKMILGCPVVDFSSLNPKKALKMFQKNTFYNKMAKIFAYQDTQTQLQKTNEIIGFKQNFMDMNQSIIRIKNQLTVLEMTSKQFLQSYKEIVLLFFNLQYFINQTALIISNKSYLLSCRLYSVNEKNNSYLIFHHFPQRTSTKVTIYKKLSPEEARIMDGGFNPLNEQSQKYQYIGEITKSGTFFFEVQLNIGQYICILQNGYKFEQSSQLSVLSEHPVKIQGGEHISNHYQSGQSTLLQSTVKKEKHRKKHKAKMDEQNLSPQMATPKTVLEKKVTFNSSKVQNSEISKNSGCSVKMKKEFLMKDDSDKENEEGVTYF